ncbi:MAG: hypothetical protein B7733_06265 [Myxococcales bacterium FL481]|nr:MAG: hypothetical protein B7733_06265 [Myxococcales bacterium FL481]
MSGESVNETDCARCRELESQRDEAVGDAEGYWDECRRLKAQRDELVEALHRVVEELTPCAAAFRGEDMADVPTYVATALGVANAALAKAEAKGGA